MTGNSLLNERMYTTILLGIILILFYLLYKILSPFLITIAWAMVLSIVFYPLYKFILRFLKRPWASSLLTLMIILLFIIGPFIFIIGSLVDDVTTLYTTIEERGFESITGLIEHPIIKDVTERLKASRILEDFDLKESAITALKGIGGYIAQNISSIFKNTIVLIINFFIMCFTTFYFLKDGNALVNFIKGLLPFTETQRERLEERVRESVIAAIYGGIAVGIAQGLLGGIGFYIFGISSPVFWGTTMVFFSLVPVFGTFLIWFPAGIILILMGNHLNGIGLIIYGALIISSVDNIIKPIVIGGRTRLHILMVFFSVLGGIKFFGFIGFILGPIIIALCLSILEMYMGDG
ncbi:MAG: AI-2E family transporter [Thermodesulfovibrionia bacterium]